MTAPAAVQHHVGRYTGIFEGTVVEVRDKDNLRQIRAKVDSLGSPGNDFITKWARPNNGVRRREFPEIGMGVFIQFVHPADTTDFPVWGGCFDSFPKGRSEMPGIAQKAPQDYAPMNRGLFKAPTVTWEAIGGPASAIVPEPSENPKTDPEKNHTFVAGGIVEQINTTPGAERYSISVGGQYWELNKKGAEVKRVRGRYDINRAAERRYVGGALTEVVAGLARRDYKLDYAVSVGGAVYALASALRARVGTVTLTIDADDDDEHVQGLRVESLGSLEVLSSSDMEIAGNTMQFTAQDGVKLASFGDLIMHAADGISVSAGQLTPPLPANFTVKLVNGIFSVRNPVLPALLPTTPLLMSPEAFAKFTALITALGSSGAIPSAAAAATAFGAHITAARVRPAVTAAFA